VVRVIYDSALKGYKILETRGLHMLFRLIFCEFMYLLGYDFRVLQITLVKLYMPQNKGFKIILSVISLNVLHIENCLNSELRVLLLYAVFCCVLQ
jgi:hypothetical protein